MVKYLLSIGALITTNDRGWTSLHFATSEGNKEYVELLISCLKNDEINAVTPEEKTALDLAKENGYRKIQLLL